MTVARVAVTRRTVPAGEKPEAGAAVTPRAEAPAAKAQAAKAQAAKAQAAKAQAAKAPEVGVEEPAPPPPLAQAEAPAPTPVEEAEALAPASATKAGAPAPEADAAPSEQPPSAASTSAPASTDRATGSSVAAPAAAAAIGAGTARLPPLPRRPTADAAPAASDAPPEPETPVADAAGSDPAPPTPAEPAAAVASPPDGPSAVTRHGDRTAGARRIVERHGRLAIAGGAVPLPVADVAAVAAIQVRMLRRLAAHYDTDLSSERARSIVMTLMGSLTPHAVGGAARWLIGPGLPVVGWLGAVAGGAATARLTTRVMGELFVDHLEHGTPLTAASAVAQAAG